MSPEQRAVRENLPPPGYRIGNRQTDTVRAGCDMMLLGDLLYFEAPDGTRGRASDHRAACLAAWEHFDAAHPPRCGWTVRQGDETAQCSKPEGHDGRHEYNFTRDPFAERIGFP